MPHYIDRMEEKGHTLPEASTRRRRLRFAVIAALVSLLLLVGVQSYVTRSIWDGAIRFQVRTDSTKPILWMKSGDLSKDLGAADIRAQYSDKELVSILPNHHLKSQDARTDSKLFFVSVIASGRDFEILFWTHETEYSPMPFFALYGQFEDGEYFAKIVPTPKERDFRGTVVVELP